MTKDKLIAKPERKGFYSFWRQRPNGKETTIIDGRTGDPVLIAKADVHAMNYGARNEAYRIAYNLMMED